MQVANMPGQTRPTQDQRECPLCGAATVTRGRDPLVRFLGFVMLYAAVLLLLVWLPSLGSGKALGIGILAACGLVLMRNRRTRWCPECWYADPQPISPPVRDPS